MDGGADPCSLELTVTDAEAKPVYAATIKVHITYGFARSWPRLSRVGPECCEKFRAERTDSDDLDWPGLLR